MNRTLLTREFARHNLSRWIVLLLDCSMVYLSGLVACVVNHGLANTVSNLGLILQTMLIYLSPFAAGFLLCGTYRNIFRRTSFPDLVRVCMALAFAVTVIMLLRIFLHADNVLFAIRLRDLILLSLLAVTTICGMRVGVKTLYDLYLRYTTSGGAYGYSERQLIDLEMADLLDRNPIEVDMDEIRAKLSGRRILVTGAAGSIGSELALQLASLRPQRLILIDQAESPLHNLRLELERLYPKTDCVYIVADICNGPRMERIFASESPEIVFHAAAYKHVPLMEENPCEAVRVNVCGSRQVADKCVEYDVEKMVMVSTDKAVNPTNIMGCTKRLAEIYVQSLGLAIERGEAKGKTKFVTTRFGNVLGSNGSVIPRFREQIEHGGPITVTHREIRRFFMTIPEACRLVMEAATFSTGTQIFVFDMGESVKISTLAERMINLAGLEVGRDIRIEYTGLRPGEKLYEEVLATKENTIPTQHSRIFVAKVRAYDYGEASGVMTELNTLAERVDIPDMVILMKKTVPEFISKHSEFEIYDKPAPAQAPES